MPWDHIFDIFEDSQVHMFHQLELWPRGPRFSSFVKVVVDEEGIPRQGGVPVCCNPTGRVGGICTSDCSLDPRFMKSNAQMDAERAFGEQQEREHPHRFGGPESSSGAKNGGINGSDGSGTRGSEGTKSQRSGRSKGSNASPRKEDLPGLVHRFRGANGEYNPYGQFFPAPPEPPRPPGFWPWMQSQELKTMSSPVPQYFVTNWARRVSHMNYKGWVEGPVDVEPKVVVSTSDWQSEPPPLQN